MAYHSLAGGMGHYMVQLAGLEPFAHIELVGSQQAGWEVGIQLWLQLQLAWQPLRLGQRERVKNQVDRVGVSLHPQH